MRILRIFIVHGSFFRGVRFVRHIDGHCGDERRVTICRHLRAFKSVSETEVGTVRLLYMLRDVQEACGVRLQVSSICVRRSEGSRE